MHDESPKYGLKAFREERCLLIIYGSASTCLISVYVLHRSDNGSFCKRSILDSS